MRAAHLVAEDFEDGLRLSRGTLLSVLFEPAQTLDIFAIRE